MIDEIYLPLLSMEGYKKKVATKAQFKELADYLGAIAEFPYTLDPKEKEYSNYRNAPIKALYQILRADGLNQSYHYMGELINKVYKNFKAYGKKWAVSEVYQKEWFTGYSHRIWIDIMGKEQIGAISFRIHSEPQGKQFYISDNGIRHPFRTVKIMAQ